MSDRDWPELFARLHREAVLKAKHDAKLKRAGYSNASWHPKDARRKARGMTAQIVED
jgi:hypothetical protein